MPQRHDVLQLRVCSKTALLHAAMSLMHVSDVAGLG